MLFNVTTEGGAFTLNSQKTCSLIKCARMMLLNTRDAHTVLHIEYHVGVNNRIAYVYTYGLREY
jgi:hypothetical protein